MSSRRKFVAQGMRLSFALVAARQAALAHADTAAPVLGKDYQRLGQKQPVTAPGKIEVLEFFSYACPHCYALEPYLEAWRKTLPPDVNFARVPVPFLASAEVLTKSYYAFEQLGISDRMSMPVFRAMNADHQHLDSLADIAALVSRNGVDGSKFQSIASSFAVANSAARAKRMLAAYGVDSTPTLIVQGTYSTSPAMAGGHPQSLSVVDHLIAKSRAGS